MTVGEILARKRDGGELSGAQIGYFVAGIVDGSITDYQASAWLMAVYIRGMTSREILDLTLAMRDSGSTIDLSDLPNGPALDKHSTGGVGDKTTLVVVPILAAAGVPILKMSGRGLGFSGGTIDKIESLPGLNTQMTIDAAKAQVRRIGAAIISQSEDVAPADRILYALRDVTETVTSLSLVASSVMSKKLACGAACLDLDVKVGRGAFMEDLAGARALAEEMVRIGNSAGVKTTAILTAMEEPLGLEIGNALEVREAIEVLQGTMRPGSALFRGLCVMLAARGLVAVGRERSESAAVEAVERLLARGDAFRKFGEIVAAQGGPAADSLLASLPVAPVNAEVVAETDGAVRRIDARAVGYLAVSIGAGRVKKEDRIDPAAGITLDAKVGARVRRGDLLATLRLGEQHAARALELCDLLRSAYELAPLRTSWISAPTTLVLDHVP